MLPVYLALTAVALLFLFPFYWVVISSLKSVEGMTLKPPALFPAEMKTVDIGTNSAIIAAGEDKRWMQLKDNFFLQLDGEKPTQFVKRFDHLAMEGSPDFKNREPDALVIETKHPPKIEFKKVPIERVNDAEMAVLAKLVRQTDEAFEETLFATSAQAPALDRLEMIENPKHEPVLMWSAHPDNYSKALKGPEASIGGKSSGFLLFMRNSFFISMMAVIGQILASSLVAFGFSRLWFKGRDFLFVLLLATLMVPAQVTLIPLFTIYKSLGWIDTFLPLIVPHFTAGAFNVFLIRQFMLTLPKELDESAAMDGATPFRVYRSIIFPMCAPVLIVVGLFTFVATWQDVMGPLIYLDNPDYRTVSLGLEFFRSPYVDNRPLLMAGAVLAMLPVACLFLIAQRYILSGIATTGLK
ncbi:MAG: carbohydrate ABC transporter permease [Fimbriimonas sp.]